MSWAPHDPLEAFTLGSQPYLSLTSAIIWGDFSVPFDDLSDTCNKSSATWAHLLHGPSSLPQSHATIVTGLNMSISGTWNHKLRGRNFWFQPCNFPACLLNYSHHNPVLAVYSHSLNTYLLIVYNGIGILLSMGIHSCKQGIACCLPSWSLQSIERWAGIILSKLPIATWPSWQSFNMPAVPWLSAFVLTISPSGTIPARALLFPNFYGMFLMKPSLSTLFELPPNSVW